MTPMVAAEHGRLDCLRYAHENGCPWDEFTSANAALNGHLSCLAYAHERGCPWDACTPMHAAMFGNLSCLAYAHERGCPWDERTPAWAANGGHLECLQYAYERGCPGAFDASGGRREAASKTIGRTYRRRKVIRDADVRLVLIGRLPVSVVQRGVSAPWRRRRTPR